MPQPVQISRQRAGLTGPHAGADRRAQRRAAAGTGRTHPHRVRRGPAGVLGLHADRRQRRGRGAGRARSSPRQHRRQPIGRHGRRVPAGRATRAAAPATPTAAIAAAGGRTLNNWAAVPPSEAVQRAYRQSMTMLCA